MKDKKVNIIPRTQEDFKWINFNTKQLEKACEQLIQKKKDDFAKIKSIPKEQRTFENTVYALEHAGEIEGLDSQIFNFFLELSPKKKERELSAILEQKFNNARIDLGHDKDLYRAFLEYNPKKEKLTEPQKRLYKDALKSFKEMGFHLPEARQKELKEYTKKISTLSSKFQKNLNDFSVHILCTKEELRGLPENYIANLPKDTKTGKYKIVYSYASYGPFMQFAESDKKRKEFADKVAVKGGKQNLKISKELFDLRQKIAEILGYKNYADYATEDRLVKNQKTVLNFLESLLKDCRPHYEKHQEKMNAFKASKTGITGDIVNYYDSSFYSNLYTLEHAGIDTKEVKEYFEMQNTLSEMFSLFGQLFGVSFVENKHWKLWHKEVQVFDVQEKGKVIAHLALDFYPREGKYSHMGCWNFMRGHDTDLSGKERLAPFTIIIGNFPKGSKKHPTLVSLQEVRKMFHEFGHACHDMLTRGVFDSQAGTGVNHDFVEAPSQLFEQWLKVPNILQSISKHYKTGEKMKKELVEKIITHGNLGRASSTYIQLFFALLDQEFHSGKSVQYVKAFTDEFEKKFGLVPSSPKSLFPAGFGHLVGYEASYYSYMYSLTMSYDFFSRFEREGYTNKKVGNDLRKVLEKGGSYDEMTYIKEFLGRKPNHKAFIKALGLDK
jgi:thimet oligopeptidase